MRDDESDGNLYPTNTVFSSKSTVFDVLTGVFGVKESVFDIILTIQVRATIEKAVGAGISRKMKSLILSSQMLAIMWTTAAPTAAILIQKIAIFANVLPDLVELLAMVSNHQHIAIAADISKQNHFGNHILSGLEQNL